MREEQYLLFLALTLLSSRLLVDIGLTEIFNILYLGTLCRLLYPIDQHTATKIIEVTALSMATSYSLKCRICNTKLIVAKCALFTLCLAQFINSIRALTIKEALALYSLLVIPLSILDRKVRRKSLVSETTYSVISGIIATALSVTRRTSYLSALLLSLSKLPFK